TVMVEFSAIAYSPRLALWLLRDRTLFHALGVFSATFLYALSTLAWVDREGSGTVPLFSNIVVLILLVASMLLFSMLVQRLNDLQITNVLQMIVVSNELTFAPDPKFPIRVLRDIALQEFPPGHNDRTTGVQAIDQIEHLLGRLGQCDLDGGNVRDPNGVLGVVVPMSPWEDY